MSVAPGNVFYPQPRDASTLSTRIDAEGRVVKVEVREDEEQNVKLQEIVDLLVAAGYFRARIKGLSSFDKVVGGMTWCIETCNFDVDIDLLFQENLTIGHKIGLTEKIVAVLPQMKCPHLIEPHQIQGLDFIHIYPVIQWLVKKSMETREEMGNSIRQYAISQYNKQFSLDDKRKSKTDHETAPVLVNIQTAKETYRPQRRFRRRDLPPSDEASRVRSTLLEYGYNVTSLAGFKGDGSETGDSSDPQQMTPGDQKLEEQRIEELKRNMASMDDHEGRLSAGVVGNIVNLQVSEIAREAGKYAELQAETFDGSSQSPLVRASVAIQRQKNTLEESVSRLEAEKVNLQTELESKMNRLDHLRSVRQNEESELSVLAELETDENKE